MSVYLGGNKITPLYLGGVEIAEAFFGSVRIYPDYNPLNLPSHTMRLQFENPSFDPANFSWRKNPTWTQVSSSPNVWDVYLASNVWQGIFEDSSSNNLLTAANVTTVQVLGANTTGVTAFTGLFMNSALSSLVLFDTVSATDVTYMLYRCSRITDLPHYDLGNVMGAAGMCWQCTGLTAIPAFDTHSLLYSYDMFGGCNQVTTLPMLDLSHVRDMRSMFAGCSSVTNIPLYDLSSATDTTYMFGGCYNVESGALNLYNQVSTQQNPPSNHDRMFQYCGRDTVTGAAELALIPSSWGGLGA